MCYNAYLESYIYDIASAILHRQWAWRTRRERPRLRGALQVSQAPNLHLLFSPTFFLHHPTFAWTLFSPPPLPSTFVQSAAGMSRYILATLYYISYLLLLIISGNTIWKLHFTHLCLFRYQSRTQILNHSTLAARFCGFFSVSDCFWLIFNKPDETFE